MLKTLVLEACPIKLLSASNFHMISFRNHNTDNRKPPLFIVYDAPITPYLTTYNSINRIFNIKYTYM